MLVTEKVSKENKLWALLHDAPEAYINDVARPLKPLMPNYTVMENRIMGRIGEKFGLVGTEMPAEVREVDNRILMDERAQLMKPSPCPWPYEFEPLGIKIESWTPAAAERAFLEAFFRLRT